jgi:hypothetical protein
VWEIGMLGSAWRGLERSRSTDHRASPRPYRPNLRSKGASPRPYHTSPHSACVFFMENSSIASLFPGVRIFSPYARKLAYGMIRLFWAWLLWSSQPVHCWRDSSLSGAWPR